MKARHATGLETISKEPFAAESLLHPNTLVDS
jgi:hypothetical protein